MVESLTLGATHLSIVSSVPGRPGEGRRVRREVEALDPNVVACDCDMEMALALGRAAAENSLPVDGWVMRAFREANGARTAADIEDHALLGAARAARKTGATLVPLHPASRKPGLVRRAGILRALRKPLTAKDPEARVREFDERLRQIPDLAEVETASDAMSVRRIREILFEDQATRVVAVLSAPRAARLVDRLTRNATDREMARVEFAIEDGDE